MRTQTVVAEPEMRNIQTVIVGSRLSTLKSSVRLGRTLRWYLNPESHKFETDRQRLIYMSEIMIVKKKTPITRNFTQYCFAWVFLPFVHVVL